MQIILTEKRKETMPYEAILGDLNYGTVLTNVPSNPDSVYIKVKKRKTGAGINLTFPYNDCVLLNVQYGTLRAVDGGTVVTCLDGAGKFEKAEKAEIYKK
jgi:hypothetical protein